MPGKVIEMIQPCHPHQMKASVAIKRLQELIDLHGDLKVDGLDRIEFWPKDDEGPAFFYVGD